MDHHRPGGTVQGRPWHPALVATAPVTAAGQPAKVSIIRVRQALTLLFDFEWINRNYFFGLYARSAGFIGASEELLQRGGVFFAQPVEYLVVGHARHCGDSGLHVDVALAGADGGDHRLGDALLLVVHLGDVGENELLSGGLGFGTGVVLQVLGEG